MKCPVCDWNIDKEDTLFCPECGASVKDSTGEPDVKLEETEKDIIEETESVSDVQPEQEVVAEQDLQPEVPAVADTQVTEEVAEPEVEVKKEVHQVFEEPAQWIPPPDPSKIEKRRQRIAVGISVVVLVIVILVLAYFIAKRTGFIPA